jgi:hypothetical protein
MLSLSPGRERLAVNVLGSTAAENHAAVIRAPGPRSCTLQVSVPGIPGPRDEESPGRQGYRHRGRPPPGNFEALPRQANKLANRSSALRPRVTPTFVVFDKDAAGEQAISHCVGRGLLSNGDYVVFSTVGLKESELENLYEAEVTLQAILDVVGIQLDASDLNPRRQK